MKIKLLKLVHFKRFTSLRIDLGESPAKIIALVGPNGCGKSSIFDAFEEKQKRLKPATNAKNKSFYSKKIYLENEQDDYNESKNIQLEFDGNQSLKKDTFYIRTPYRYTSSIDSTEIRALQDPVADKNRPASTSDIDNRLKENYERLQSKLINAFYKGDMTGKEVRKELTGKMNSILSNILDIEIVDIGNVLDRRGTLYFKKGNSNLMPYNILSSGEKEVIDLIVDIIIKTEFYSDTVFCIDEPELHISTQIQRKLIVEIEKLIPNNCQLWIATHSVGFLRAFQDELSYKSQVIDFSNKDFDTEHSLMPIDKTRKDWKRIFSTALDDLTGLISPKKIIYCEGKQIPSQSGREQGLDARVYNKIFELECSETLFVSSGGNTELDNNASIALAVLNKAFDDVDILLLKDKDIWPDGKPTTDEERGEWLEKHKNGRMLKRKEIENYLFDYEIILKAYPNTNEEDYKEIIKDIDSEDVKKKGSMLLELVDDKQLENSGVGYRNRDLMR